MSKKSIVQRELKREKLVSRYAKKRADLLAIARDIERPLEERWEARRKLALLPRNSAKNRLRNRCQETGRPRGVLRKFKLCRNMIRKYASKGYLPGLTKASW